MRRIFVLVLGLAVVWLAGCAGSRKDTIRIAVVSPLTGPQAEMGQGVANGARLAVDEANQRLKGRLHIELLLMDDKADPKEAVSVANKLIADDSVVGVVGHMNSGTTIPASEVYHRGSLPMITPDATNPVITERGFDNVYRVCITDRVQGPAAADYAVSKLGLHRLAVIHDKSAYGQGIAGEFRKRAEQLKAEVLCFEGISEGDRDFSPVLTKVRSLRADGIYFGGMYPEGALLMKQARSLGISSRFLVGDGCFDPELIKIGGASAEGTLITFLAPPWEQHDSAKAFVKKYESEYGPVKAYAPLSYDAANILIDAIERARTRDRRNVNAVLKSPGYVYNGIVGPTSFDSHGDVRGRKPFIYTVTGGRFVLAGTGK